MNTVKYLILIAVIFSASLPARSVCAQEGMVILTGDVLIEYEDYFSPNSAVRALKTAGLRQIKELGAPNLFRCKLPADMSDNMNPEEISSFLDDLRSLAVVKHAEADFIVFDSETSAPDDEYYQPTAKFPLGQWSLISSEPYSINADLAWERATGEGKIIAILDNGFTFTHNDLLEKVWFYDVVDHPEPPISDFTDKRYIDIHRQYPDFRLKMYPTGDWQVPDDGCENEFFHGLACTGIAAARMNNDSYGIVGVAPDAGIGMIRISATYTGVLQIHDTENDIWEDLQPEEYRQGVRYSNIIEAIHRAVPALSRPDRCARVINLSIGIENALPVLVDSAIDGQLLQRAIDFVHSFHCVIVASTGNGGMKYVLMPARLDKVLAVGASTRDGHVWYKSNFGPEVDLVAPGVDIVTTMPVDASPMDYVASRLGVEAHINNQNDEFIQDNGEFALRTGTSFATAHVTGAVAVLQSYLIESEAHVIEHLLLSTARATLDPAKDGHGLIDLAAAIEKATVQNFSATLIDPPAAAGPTRALQGEGPHINLSWDAYTEFEFDSYDIWRRVDDGEWRYHDFVDDSITEYIDTDITPGYEYYYEIRARIAPYGRPGHLPPGFPLWMSVSICGRSEPDTIDYQGGGSGETGRYPGTTGADKDQVPDRLSLSPNYPNPFNPSTTIRFGLPGPSHARLLIMNVRGEIVKVLVDDEMEAGWHAVTWDGRNAAGREVASGIYLYLVEIRGRRILRKMTLLR